MPIECEQLRTAKCPLEICPKCGEKFEPFLRGLVQRRKITFWRRRPRPYCAVICEACKEIVGHESPDGSFEIERSLCPKTNTG